MTDDNSSGFVPMVDEKFIELEDSIVAALPDNDVQYAKLKDRQHELMIRFPKLTKWLEESDGALSLTADEHAAIVEYLDIAEDMEGIVRLAIYNAGQKNV